MIPRVKKNDLNLRQEVSYEGERQYIHSGRAKAWRQVTGGMRIGASSLPATLAKAAASGLHRISAFGCSRTLGTK